MLPPGSQPPGYGDRRRWGRKPKTGATTRGIVTSTPSFSPRAYLRFRGDDNANKRNVRSAGAIRTGSLIFPRLVSVSSFSSISLPLRFKTVVVVVATLSFYLVLLSFFYTFKPKCSIFSRNAILNFQMPFHYIDIENRATHDGYIFYNISYYLEKKIGNI